MLAMHIVSEALYQPSTFAERGVLVPFTAPSLTGTRVRRARQGGMELLVPNPSGGRGVYIIGPEGIMQLCRPSIHDLVLNERIGKLPMLTPGRVRMTAAQVAAEGFAGRAAIGAAQAAIQAQALTESDAFYELMLALLAASGLSAAKQESLAAMSKAAMREQAPALLGRIAGAIGRSPDVVVAVLLDMAETFASFGVSQTASGTVQRCLQALGRLLTQAADWPRRLRANASRIGAAAMLTITQTEHAIAKSRAAMADPVVLLRSWCERPEQTAEQIGLPDWLLDGWEQVCLLMQSASNESLLAARLEEIVLLLPAWPRTMRERFNLEADANPGSANARGQTEENSAMGGTNVMDLTLRNEALRLSSLELAGAADG